MLTAKRTLEREQGARRRLHKIQARVERRSAAFRAPIGYKYVRYKAEGSVLIKDGRFAAIIQEALEGFATGRFQTRVEVKRFLEAQPQFPRNAKGEVHAQRVTGLLTRVLYAGYIEAPQSGVSLRKGQHEALISLETYTRIQERLARQATAPARKDLSQDFPLRGCIRCADCGTPLTAAWSTGRYARYPYYQCYRRGCASYKKSIRREVLEDAFEALLKTLHPPAELFRALRAMFKKAWDQRVHSAAATARALEQELVRIQSERNKLLERITQGDTPSMIAALEARIRELEEQKRLMEARIANAGRAVRDFDTSLRSASEFLANPYRTWKSGPFEIKRIVLKLALASGLTWSRHRGLRTANLPLLFRLKNLQARSSR